ncbi:MAG: hypothetical protein R3F11_07695 [Verrucomicrobiales bacterium]
MAHSASPKPAAETISDHQDSVGYPDLFLILILKQTAFVEKEELIII